MDRRGALTAVLGAAAGALAVRAFVTGPNQLHISTHVVRSQEPDARSARILQLSDLHLRRIGRLERRILRAARMARPDVIVITGDSITRRPALGVLNRFLYRMEGIAPVFAVLGNWDRWSGATVREIRELYARRGCTLLVNESRTLVLHGTTLRLTGVDDLVSGAPSARQGLDAARPGETHIILSHSPAFRERLWREMAESRAVWSGESERPSPPALMLAGHTHGGQVRLLGLAPVKPRGSGRYLEGWYRDARPHLYVSRGFGTSAIRARLGAPPELAIFDVQLPQGRL